ncbi:hypothetical protein [Bacillus paramycoides]
MLSLHIIKALKENFNYSVAIFSIGTDILIHQFQKYSPVYYLEEQYPTEEKMESLIKKVLSHNYHRRHTNSVMRIEDSYSRYNAIAQMQYFIKDHVAINDISI